MHRAEVVDRSQEVEARFEGYLRAGQVPRSPREYGKSLSEGRVQAFDVTGRDHSAADLSPEPGKPFPRPTRQMDDPSGLHVLDKYELRPGQKARASTTACPQRKAEDALEGLSVAAKAIDHNQKRAGKRRAANHLSQGASGLLAALGCDQASEPQARRDADRREEVEPPAAPTEASLRLGPNEDLVGLNVAKHLRMQDKRLVDLSAVGTGLEEPVADRATLEAKGGGDRGRWTAICDQGNHRHNETRVGLRVEKGCVGPLGKGLSALGAPITFSSPAVDLNIAPGGMPPSRTIHIWTEGRKRVHVSRSFVGLEV